MRDQHGVGRHSAQLAAAAAQPAAAALPTAAAHPAAAAVAAWACTGCASAAVAARPTVRKSHAPACVARKPAVRICLCCLRLWLPRCGA